MNKVIKDLLCRVVSSDINVKNPESLTSEEIAFNISSPRIFITSSCITLESMDACILLRFFLFWSVFSRTSRNSLELWLGVYNRHKVTAVSSLLSPSSLCPLSGIVCFPYNSQRHLHCPRLSDWFQRFEFWFCKDTHALPPCVCLADCSRKLFSHNWEVRCASDLM